MLRLRRWFGPFRPTTIVAVVVIASLPFWETGMQQYTAWRLSRQLHDPAEAVRSEAADGLVQLGPAATEWVIGAMHDPDPAVRRLACSIVGRTVTDGATGPVEDLLAAVHDGDASVRAVAVEQLVPIISRGPWVDDALRERALRSLCDALEDESHQVALGGRLSPVRPGPKSVAGHRRPGSSP